LEVGILDSSLKNIITKALGVLFLSAAIIARENGQSLLMQAAFAGIGIMLIKTNTENE
jgi:hypothetical protein